MRLLILLGGVLLAAPALRAQTPNAVVTPDKYCFTLSGQAVTTGTCDPGDNQVLAEYNARGNYYRFLTDGGYCLTATAKGSSLTDARCDGARPTNQRWWISNDGQFQSQANNLCADVEGGLGNNRRVLMWDCHGGQNQRFAFGIIRPRGAVAGASSGALTLGPNRAVVGGQQVAAGVISTGGLNVIATGGGNVISTGGGNLIGQAGGN